MNAPFKVAFAFFIACAACLIGALIVGYVLEDEFWTSVVAGSGVALALAGIILALCSRKKPPKRP